MGQRRDRGSTATRFVEAGLVKGDICNNFQAGAVPHGLGPNFKTKIVFESRVPLQHLEEQRPCSKVLHSGGPEQKSRRDPETDKRELREGHVANS